MKDVLFLDKGDIRQENRELAFKGVFRELRGLGLPEVHDVLNRWGVGEAEIGTRLSVDIEFPADYERHQYFIENGKVVIKAMPQKKAKKKG